MIEAKGKPIQTKWGTAKVWNTGYYTISDNSTGNYKKLLHRLIFEDFYQCDLDEVFPEGVVIHHEDGNKLNNAIWNLVLMTRKEHIFIHRKELLLNCNPPSGENHHMYGKSLSEEVKLKISESKKGVRLSENTKYKMSSNKNTSGFYCVSTKPCPNCNTGFSWIYQYYDENMKHRVIHSVNLLKLKERVLKKGLSWKIMNIDNAKLVCKKYGYNLEDLI